MSVQRNLFLMARTGFFGPSLALELAGDSMSRNNKVLENYWIQLEDMTDRLLRRHWKEVTALAEGLLAHGTLSGKEVVSVIEANQSADAAGAENVPGTLAAIRSQVRAQASAGARGAPSSTESFYVPAAAGMGAGDVTTPEEVVVINGSATPPTPPAPALAARHPAAGPCGARAHPKREHQWRLRAGAHPRRARQLRARRAAAAMRTFVLSGGGKPSGPLEVGAVRALLERGIQPEMIVGSSAGALNGAMLASNPTLEMTHQMRQLWVRARASAG